VLVDPVRRRWVVRIQDGPDLDILGNVLDCQYTFFDGRTPVAIVSKTSFPVADTSGVEIAHGKDLCGPYPPAGPAPSRSACATPVSRPARPPGR
jgi:hypothetical protein